MLLFKAIARRGLPLRALVVVPLALLLACGAAFAQEITGVIYGKVIDDRVYAGSCGLKTAFLGNGGRNAATIFSLRYPSSR